MLNFFCSFNMSVGLLATQELNTIINFSSFLDSNPVSSKQQDAGVPVHLLPWGQLVVVISLRELIKTV